MAPSHYLKITNLRLQTYFPGTNELNIYSLSDSRCIIACTRFIKFQMLKDMHLFSVSHDNQDLAGASAPDAPTPQGSRNTRSSVTDDVTTGTPGDQDARDSTPRVPKPVSPRKQKLKKTISYLRTRISCLKVSATPRSTKSVIHNVCQELDGLLPEETAKFVKSQIIANQRKSKSGNRWTLSDKMFALSIFYHSRKAYRILQKLFVLPSKTTLKELLGKSKVYPGFDSNIFDALEKRVSKLPKQDRQCVLIFDEMGIKSSLSYNVFTDGIEGLEDFGCLGQTKFMANHGLSFMVRGLSKKWKQSIGYFLTSGPVKGNVLKDLTMEAITRLQAIGLHVKVLVCDQGSNNRQFPKSFSKVSVDKPYFSYSGKKVYVIYDPPHLIKNVRNNLKKTGFLHEGNPISWEYIVKFYMFDKEGDIRMAPKLTDEHIDIPMFSKMKVNLAVQVLSHSVAAGISTLQRLGHLPKEAKFTGEFVEHMDQLFNCFNSSNLRSSKKFGGAISDDSGHMEFLEDSFQFMSNLTLQNGKVPPCIEGWQISIKSLILLWKELSSQCNFSFLMTNRLNQDCVENLFSIIRGKGGKRDNPDAREFRASYRQVVFDQLLMPSEGSNCKVDTDDILLNLTNLDRANSVGILSGGNGLTQNVPDKVPGAEIIPVIKPPASVPIQNVEAYMAGYLLRKSGISQCDTCKSNLNYNVPPDSDVYVFLKEKAYKNRLSSVLKSGKQSSMLFFLQWYTCQGFCGGCVKMQKI